MTKVDYISHVVDMERVANAYIEKYTNVKDKVVFGFDAEWCRGETGIRIIGISFPGEKVRLFNLNAAGIYDETTFQKTLKELLEKKNLIPAGVNVGGGSTRMLNFGVRMKKYCNGTYF